MMSRMPGTTAIKAWISLTMRERLDERLAAERARRREIFAAPEWRPTSPMSSSDRAALSGRARAHLADLRERGELLDTIDVLMRHAVQAELDRRGWLRRWPPVPAQAPQGRWPGSIAAGWPLALSASVPVRLAEQVRAGCWHTSKDAIEALRRWRDRHPGVITRFNDPLLWEEYEALAAKVTTPGRVWRAALAHLLDL